mgnify:CR=1 FL=1
MSVWVPVLLGGLGLAVFAWLAYRLSLRWWPSLALRVLLLALIVWAVGDGLARGADPGLLPEILLVDVSDSLTCLLYTSPSPRDRTRSRMPSSA